MEELIKKIKEDYFKSALEYFKAEAEHEKEFYNIAEFYSHMNDDPYEFNSSLSEFIDEYVSNQLKNIHLEETFEKALHEFMEENFNEIQNLVKQENYKIVSATNELFIQEIFKGITKLLDVEEEEFSKGQ